MCSGMKALYPFGVFAGRPDRKSFMVRVLYKV
jgi:hypothetical protein